LFVFIIQKENEKCGQIFICFTKLLKSDRDHKKVVYTLFFIKMPML